MIYSHVKMGNGNFEFLPDSGYEHNEVVYGAQFLANCSIEELVSLLLYKTEVLPTPKFVGEPTGQYHFELNDISGVVGYRPEYTILTLSEAKTKAVNDINEKAKELLAQATVKYSAAEMAGWETLEREAIQYLADGTVGNMIGGEAFMSNQDVGVLANEVVGNATAFRNYRNFIVSTRYKKTQAVNALTTIEELIAYDLTINDGWIV